MAEIRTYPYLTPDSKHIVLVNSWQYFNQMGVISQEKMLQDWDASTTIEAEITLKLNLKNILRDCGLDRDAKIRLVIGWRSSGTMLRGSGNRIDIDSINSREPFTLRTKVCGTDVSRDLTLFAALILVSPGSEPQTLSPRIPGSVLWHVEDRLILDDENQYFPIQIISFHVKDWKIPTNAAWYLQWDSSDLHQTTYGDLQLYINSDHPTVMSILNNNQPLSDLLHKILFFDVARALILGVLSNPEFVEDPSQYPEGTVGSVVYNIIREYFPEHTVIMLYEISKNQNLFDAMLQHQLAFLRS